VKSEPGAGASFFVALPIGDGPMKPALEKEPLTADIGAGAVVLVVEDEAALGAAVAESLGDAGFVVDRAGNGEEAIGRVRARAYDLIICDLKMPRVDGMQFYRMLERDHPEAARRILFVTGDVAGTDAERFLEETGCRWLAKPFRLRDLLRTAQEILRP
jgi:two-component system, cell cycle sensor histidine kinase and response regulator CckA